MRCHDPELRCLWYPTDDTDLVGGVSYLCSDAQSKTSGGFVASIGWDVSSTFCEKVAKARQDAFGSPVACQTVSGLPLF